MEVDNSRTSDTLLRPEGNDLKSNYDLHDIGSVVCESAIRDRGLVVEEWGIDMRDDDQGLIYDNKMDMRLWKPRGNYGDATYWPNDDITSPIHHEGNREYKLTGICDVKTKSNPDWLGIFNLRHMAHYAAWADTYDVPVFIFFGLLSGENNEAITDTFVVEVPDFDNHYDYVRHYDRDTDYTMDSPIDSITEDCPVVSRAFEAPDRNAVVVIDEQYRTPFSTMIESIA